MPLLRLVLDLLVPHSPGVVIYAERLADLEGVDGVTVDVIEADAQTKTLEVTIEGSHLPFDRVSEIVDSLGGALHSVDEVSAGTRIVLTKGASRREGR
jgi:hypothetical protein